MFAIHSVFIHFIRFVKRSAEGAPLTLLGKQFHIIGTENAKLFLYNPVLGFWGIKLSAVMERNIGYNFNFHLDSLVTFYETYYWYTLE